MNGEGTTVAIACQGGGSHTAFTAGVLRELLPAVGRSSSELVGLSGTSGGAFSAVAGWYGRQSPGTTAPAVLSALWDDIAAAGPVDLTVNAALVWATTLEGLGVPVPETSPYQQVADDWSQRWLRRTLESHVDFEQLRRLAGDGSPTLVVGAVDITAGEFTTFVDGDVTADAVLASAAVPELFEAVEIDGAYHWDGLFSQNPPIRDFFDASVERKPDELWVVQINPQARDREPRSLRAVVDRRNELAGNLSLNQELRTVELINEFVETGRLGGEYKQTTVRRIELDRELPYASKLDRRPSFVDDLLAAGEAAAREFLAGLDGYTSTSTG